jgi:hypothetical protein
MALEIGSGIFIGGSISVTNEISIVPNQLLLLDAGNSQSYSGSGVLNSFGYLNGVHNLATANVAGNLTGFTATAGWVNQGDASYFLFNADDGTYINTQYMANVLPGGSGYTYASWVRPQDYAAGAIVGGSQSIFYFQSNGGPSGGPALAANNVYDETSAVIDDTTVFETNTWYFVAVTYDSTSQSMKLWVNGVNTASGSAPPFVDPEPLYWGSLQGEINYTGRMGLATVYDKPLSDVLMLELYNEYADRYIEPVTTSSALYTLPGSYTFTVPEGVTSISTVVVGGGGGGTADSYSSPGGDTFLYIENTTVSAQTLYTTTPGNTTANIYVNSITTPAIANVTANGTWLVSGSAIVGPAIAVDLVTAVDAADPGNVIITINKQISTTAGDSFVFLQSIAAAEGAYEIDGSIYSGPAAQVLVGTGGAGGVVNPGTDWPIGGGGAGGYAGAGGQGTAGDLSTATAGTGGAGGGGGGRIVDSGGGGGSTGLYGQSTDGSAGTFDTVVGPDTIGLGGGGGSVGGDSGGPATSWNGGRGGSPGGGGGSATDYWVAGNGGALAYRNNYTVTPGQGIGVYVGIGGQGQGSGGSGGPGAVRIVWPGNTRQYPATNVGPDTVTVPTLAITGDTLGQYTGTVNWNITSNGGGTVLETGIVWGLPGQVFYANSTDICDGTSSTAERKAIRAEDDCGNPYTTGLTGAQTLNFQPSFQFYDDLINIRVYARNEAGVAYSATTLTWTPVICLAEGTAITLADGNTKLIENITMSDLIRVWDFDMAAATSAQPLWIKRKESTIQYNLIRFSDGSELKTIGQHRIFNKEAGAFTYPMTADTPVGTTTIKSDGSEVTVTDKRVMYEAVNYYNVITDGGYMNLYANDILTSLRYNNIYPIGNMQYTKDGRVLRDRAEFAGIADRWIDGLRLQEQTIDIKDIRKYVKRLEANEAGESLSAHPSWHK